MTSFPERLLPADLGSIHERRLAKIFANVDTARTEGVVFASPDWGGAITHLFGPRYKPVYDDRTVVVGEGLYRAYAESFQQPSTFQRLVTTFGITHVLIPSGIDLASYLRQQSGWKEGDSVDGYSLFSVK